MLCLYLYPPRDGQAECSSEAWINTEMVDRTNVVTNPSTNWARRSLILLMHDQWWWWRWAKTTSSLEVRRPQELVSDKTGSHKMNDKPATILDSLSICLVETNTELTWWGGRLAEQSTVAVAELLLFGSSFHWLDQRTPAVHLSPANHLTCSTCSQGIPDMYTHVPWLAPSRCNSGTIRDTPEPVQGIPYSNAFKV